MTDRLHSANDVGARLRAAAAWLQEGRLDEAVAALGDVIGREPKNAAARYLIGLALLRSGQLAPAAESLTMAAALDPRNAAAHATLADTLAALGRPAEALQSYDKAVALNLRHPDLYYNRANALAQLGRLAEALAGLDQAIALNSGHALAHVNRGAALLALDRPLDALHSLDRAIALQPALVQAHGNRAGALLRLNRPREALASSDQAIGLDPRYAKAQVSRGHALFALDRLEEALASHDSAIVLRPDLAEAHSSRANALRCLNRHDEAMTSCRRALELDASVGLHNLACIHLDLGRNAEAAAAAQAQLERSPDHAEAQLTLAYVTLAEGDFAQGWRLYEARWKLAHPESFPAPLWLGQTDPAGKTILLHSEQGLGDILQFCRYAPLVAARGARVILRAPRPLLRLLSSLEGVSQVVGEGDPLPSFDLHCPLMSLPLAFGHDVAGIPAAIPYLRATPEAVRAWTERLGSPAKPRIGLVWSGGFRPGQPERRGVNQRRNMPFAALAPLLRTDLQFVSLQKDEPARSEAKAWPIVDLMDGVADFADTAALVQTLDLVIAVDTSTAHLAGAMGKPVWLLSRFDACWRWLSDRSDSPWYPSLRLYRQPAPGDWGRVVETVKRDLAERFPVA